MRKPENMSSITEKWSPYPLNKRIKVSTLGRVTFTDRNTIRNIRPNKSGRNTITTTVNGKKIKYSVAVMVLETFHGQRPTGYTCSHLNGIPHDDRVENLIWESHSENCQRKIQHGTSQAGERNGESKLKLNQVEIIRNLKGKISSRILGEKYGVSKTQILRIWSRKSWR